MQLSHSHLHPQHPEGHHMDKRPHDEGVTCSHFSDEETGVFLKAVTELRGFEPRPLWLQDQCLPRSTGQCW